MTTANGDYFWEVQNPPSSFDTTGTVNFFYPVGQTPTVNSASVISCNPTSGTANAGEQSYTGASSTGVRRGLDVKWQVSVTVNLSNVTTGADGYASGSGQVQVDYS